MTALVAAGAASGVLAMAGMRTGVARSVEARLSGQPAAEDVQLAYDAAKIENRVRHFDDLKIRDAACSNIGGRRYTCQIDFVRTLEPEGRLFFTVVTLEAADRSRWNLIGGLCKAA
jgi:hypothetical protein